MGVSRRQWRFLGENLRRAIVVKRVLCDPSSSHRLDHGDQSTVGNIIPYNFRAGGKIIRGLLHTENLRHYDLKLAQKNKHKSSLIALYFSDLDEKKLHLSFTGQHDSGYRTFRVETSDRQNCAFSNDCWRLYSLRSHRRLCKNSVFSVPSIFAIVNDFIAFLRNCINHTQCNSYSYCSLFASWVSLTAFLSSVCP